MRWLLVVGNTCLTSPDPHRARVHCQYLSVSQGLSCVYLPALPSNTKLLLAHWSYLLARVLPCSRLVSQFDLIYSCVLTSLGSVCFIRTYRPVDDSWRSTCLWILIFVLWTARMYYFIVSSNRWDLNHHSCSTKHGISWEALFRSCIFICCFFRCCRVYA